jgi:hypothetical protein
MSCDCPHDFGPVCKHEAAVLYALQNKGEKALEKPAGPTKMKRLQTALEGLDQDRLISILLGFAAKDRLIRDELLARFSGEADLLKSVREMVKSSISGAMQYGFVEYRDVGMAVDGAEKALDIAESKKDGGDHLTAVSVSIVILRETVKLLNCCDDSNGIVGGVIDTAVHLIIDSVKNSKDNSGKLFELVFNHAAEKIYDAWNDWRFEMLDACIPFCADPLLREKMDAYLDSLISTAKSDYHTNWTSNHAQEIRREIIKKFDGLKAADIYLEKNIEYNEGFRNIAIEKAITAENYDRALQLCLEGEQKNERYPGRVSNYRRKRYTIYEKQKNISGQKELARAFVLGGDFDYYKKLKALYTKTGWPATKTEWPAVLTDLIKNLENTGYTGQVYIDICVHEHFWEKLLALCQKKPDYLVELYPHLVPQYAAELAPLFTARIRKDAQNAGDRGSYRQVCEFIRHYIKVCGKPEAKKLIAELRETYRRRPAFVDELGRINA